MHLYSLCPTYITSFYCHPHTLYVWECTPNARLSKLLMGPHLALTPVASLYYWGKQQLAPPAMHSHPASLCSHTHFNCCWPNGRSFSHRSTSQEPLPLQLILYLWLAPALLLALTLATTCTPVIGLSHYTGTCSWPLQPRVCTTGPNYHSGLCWPLTALPEEDAKDSRSPLSLSRPPTVFTKAHRIVSVVDLKGLSQGDIISPFPRSKATGIMKSKENLSSKYTTTEDHHFKMKTSREEERNKGTTKQLENN